MARICASMILCLGLSACGGGGGGSAPVDAPVVTAENYVSVAQSTLNSTRYLTSASNLFGSTLTGVQASGGVPLVRFGTARLFELKNWMPAGAQQVSGVVQSTSINCPGGGSMLISANDANNNGIPDAGDSFNLTMSNCMSGGETVNGGLAFTLNSVSGDLNTNVFSIEAQMTFNDLRATTASTSDTGNGSMTVKFASRGMHDYSASLAISSFTATSSYAGSTTTVTLTSFSISEVTSPVGAGFNTVETMSGTITSSAFGNKSLVISTMVPFTTVNSNLYPSSGQLVITDASSRKVRVTATSAAMVLIEGDVDANGSYEISIVKQWSELV